MGGQVFYLFVSIVAKEKVLKSWSLEPLLFLLFWIIMKHGKKYVEVKKLVEKTKFYPLADAIELLRKVNYAKFDAGI